MLITRSVEPRKVYGHVDWGLLVFFVGLFIIVAGAERAAAEGVHVGFRDYFRVGLPVTIATLILGSIWLAM